MMMDNSNHKTTGKDSRDEEKLTFAGMPHRIAHEELSYIAGTFARDHSIAVVMGSPDEGSYPELDAKWITLDSNHCFSADMIRGVRGAVEKEVPSTSAVINAQNEETCQAEAAVEEARQIALPHGPILVTTLQKAIAQSGISDNELARRAGVSQPIVNRFRNEKMGLTLISAAKIAEALGLSLTKK